MTKSNHKELIIYVLWLIFGLLYFDHHSAQFDELLMLDILLSTQLESLLYVLTSVEIQMPFSYIVGHVLAEVSSDQLWVMRIPSLLFTLLTPVPLYLWAKEKLGEGPAKFVPVLWMFSYPTIYYFYSIRPYSALVFFFVSFLFFIESGLSNQKMKKKAVLSFGLLLCLTHPVGLLAVGLSLLWLFLKFRSYRTHPVTLGSLFFVVLTFFLFVFTRVEDLSTFLSPRGLIPSLAVSYESLGFIFSGIPFAFLTLSIVVYALFKKKDWCSIFTGYSFFISVSILISLLLLQVLSSMPVGPRHFIITLPFIIFVFSWLVFNCFQNQSAVRSVIYLGVLCLSYKSFVVEDLLRKPQNLNSTDLATKVFDYSAFGEKVVSCGNCPSYYIRDERLVCLASMDELDLESIQSYFVLVEFSHIGQQCNSEVLNPEYKVYRKTEVEGATIKYYVER